MYDKRVKDIMIPVSQYPCIKEDASMYDAIVLLKKAIDFRAAGQEPFRAVLVKNNEGLIIGKVGLLGFLKGLEPKYQSIFDIEKLSRVPQLSAGFLDSLVTQYNLWENNPLDLCTQAKTTNIKDIMIPIDQHIDQDETIKSAIHKIIMWQTVSILVSSGEEIVGILRLKDLYLSVEDYIINEHTKK